MAEKHILTVHQGMQDSRVPFTGMPNLAELLAEHGYPVLRPCGGRGVCGKCRLRVQGDFEIAKPDGPGQTADPAGKAGPAEDREKYHLACRTRLCGNAEVWLEDPLRDMRIETADRSAAAGSARFPERKAEADFFPAGRRDPEEKLGFSADLGTTTLALRLYRLQDGMMLAEAAAPNPQISVAADVMGRIQASLTGHREVLKNMLSGALAALLREACGKASVPCRQVEKGVATGNTTMLYLLTGQDPASLATAPYTADCLFDLEEEWQGITVYLPPCGSAFFGADALCAVLAAGQCDSEDISLLCDIGTNGETALWKAGKLWVASVAAGPAFEGAGIRCGCGSVRGAIDSVWAFGNGLEVHVLGDAVPRGLCGSGLIDAIAAGLDLNEISETGEMEAERLHISGNVALWPEDIRAVQLAKASVLGGMQTLMEEAGILPEQIGKFFLAGGFGSRLNLRSAARIGLLPAELISRTVVLGNAALAGASLLLTHAAARDRIREIASSVLPVPLGGNPRFQEYYLAALRFPGGTKDVN